MKIINHQIEGFNIYGNTERGAYYLEASFDGYIEESLIGTIHEDGTFMWNTNANKIADLRCKSSEDVGQKSIMMTLVRNQSNSTISCSELSEQSSAGE